MQLKEVIVAGNPNCGKTSLYNLLTGLRQKTSNVPGTTVEVKKSLLRLNEQHTIEIIDLPGAYSINPFTDDEKEATDYLNHKLLHESETGILYVADASNLKRNLMFFSQIAAYKKPMILVLTMVDVAEKKGIKINRERLESELGIPVLMINPKKASKAEIQNLMSAIAGATFSCHYNFPVAKEQSSEEAVERYKSIESLLGRTVEIASADKRLSLKLDKWLLHPFWGMFFFLFTMLLVFQAVFFLAEFPMTWIENAFSWLTEYTQNHLNQGFLSDLLTGGLLPGLSGVVVFLPQIIILFFLLTILEDSGYMARITYLMDWPLRKFGLSGKSVLPLISGTACAIPAILSSRSIDNKKERLVTMLVTPFMSCSARLPVYILLAGLIVPEKSYFYIFNIRGLLLLGMYVLGFIMSLVVAAVITLFLRKYEKGVFLMELPVYQLPNLRNVWHVCYSKSLSFVNEAGKIILVVSVLLWFLASHGYGTKWEQAVAAHSIASPETQSASNAALLKASYAGQLGKIIEPVIRPLGYDWKIGIALITSFAAREVFVGTLSTIYGLQDESDYRGIREKMASDKDADTQKPVYSLAVALSLMVFYAFAMQCISTLAVLYKETKSFKWPAIQFTFMTVIAYAAAALTYSVFS